MSRYNKLQTYILKKYSRTFLEILSDHGVGLISQQGLLVRSQVAAASILEMSRSLVLPKLDLFMPTRPLELAKTHKYQALCNSKLVTEAALRTCERQATNNKMCGIVDSKSTMGSQENT